MIFHQASTVNGSQFNTKTQHYFAPLNKHIAQTVPHKHIMTTQQKKIRLKPKKKLSQVTIVKKVMNAKKQKMTCLF